MDARKKRADNVLLGQFVGDALGTTHEFKHASECTPLQDIVGGGPFHMLPGQVTDDGEMAIACARALKTRGFDQDGRREAYEAWAATNPPDIGTTTAQAFRARTPNPLSQANGALMRISPLAVYASALPLTRAIALAHEDAVLSHPHEVCLRANAAFVTAIHIGINGGSSEEAFAAAKTHLPELTAEMPVCDGANQGWVLIASNVAFHQLRSGRSFADALNHTICQGGDTDTNGAITGALLGAFRDDLPPHWTERVLTCKTPRPYHPSEALGLYDPLFAAFADTLYEVQGELIRVGQRARRDFALLTAFNPMGRPAADNHARQRELIAALTGVYETGHARAYDGSHVEECILVQDMDRAAATALGRRFGQAAILLAKAEEPVRLVDLRG